ncbi:CsbD family protein [Microbacterium rhizosphaerae]|uniref:CsbD family protein n=1 Tax=Microbacterium rhizosphaerae TaxID=1678237 RepID=A0ABZ0SKC6_9MICO|nr:CsbD family protein [Microbacterium rhizosphaerae]WPR88263.1 CsbD family protein [Microbacterium rhizosphaerae]
MGEGDRIENDAQHLKGQAEEAWGKVTGDDSTRVKGKVDQASADMKNGVEDVKDDLTDDR